MLRYHYSENDAIEVFHPRAPLRHPDTPPRVYSIDAAHRALYFFPRDCSRLGVWCTPHTNAANQAAFTGSTARRMLILVDASQSALWQSGQIYEYTFDGDEGWQDTADHGCWISEVPQTPTAGRWITNLPHALREEGVEVQIVPDLLAAAEGWRAQTTLHVSAIRLSSLGGPKGTPVGQ